MGLSMVDCRAGALVWVQRKNGTWWPGRVVGPNEISPSHLVYGRPGTPVKLLGREDTSVDWYNLKKSKRVKAFRCGEFDDCIKCVESSQVKVSVNITKKAFLKDAILHALELEKKEVQKKRKPGGEQAGNICQAKRSRRVSVPAELNNGWNHAVPQPEPLQLSSSIFQMHESPQEDGSAESESTSKSTKSVSSRSDSQGLDGVEEATQLSDAAILEATQPGKSSQYDEQHGYTNGERNHELSNLCDSYMGELTGADFRLQKQEPEGKAEICNLSKFQGHVIDFKTSLSLKSGIQGNGESSTLNAALDRHNRDEIATNSGESSVLAANYPSPVGLETTLSDVELTVQASYRGEHAPLVSLMSRLNGKAIVGHPIHVEASDDGSSEIPLAGEDNIGSKLFGNNGSKMLLPVWRTSKRTPVCYAPLPPSRSSRKKDKQPQACQTSSRSYLQARANSLPPKQECLRKPLKNPHLPIQKTRTLSSFTASKKHSKNEGYLQHVIKAPTIDELLKPKDGLPARVSCIPVKLIFSKLLDAVGWVQA